MANYQTAMNECRDHLPAQAQAQEEHTKKKHLRIEPRQQAGGKW